MKEDILEIERLRKIARPSINDMESIYILYKKYIDPKAPRYTTSCNTCNTSIVTYYWKIMALDLTKLKETNDKKFNNNKKK